MKGCDFLKEKFNITGMNCSACSSHIEKAVSKLNGINNVNVNLLTNSMEVDFNHHMLTTSDIINTVVNSGYGASLINSNKKSTDSKSYISTENKELKSMKHRLIISFLFLIPLMYISMGHMLGIPVFHVLTIDYNPITFALTQFLLTLPIVYINRKFFIVGYKSLFKKSPNMDTLVALSSSASLVYGIYIIYKISIAVNNGMHHEAHLFAMNLYFESAAMILTLITLGKYLETRSKGKTKESIKKLMGLSPKMATIIRNNKEVKIPVEEVLVNDIVIVKPGESIPVDGIIIEGNTSIDESLITGESIPKEKTINDKVISATINKNGFIKFKALKVGSETTLSQIIKLVEDATASKAPIAKLADKVSGIFVPFVISIALIAFLIWLLLGYSFDFSLTIGISVLVISCPCALGLATPVAIMVGTSKGALNGILIKNAESLEITHKIDTIVFDKTGTITYGKPKVTDIYPNNIEKSELLKIAASLEKSSEHPLSLAICDKFNETNDEYYNTEDFLAVTGKGIKGTINNKTYYAGNLAFMKENNINLGSFKELSEKLSKDYKTPLYFASSTEFLGIIAVADEVKDTSALAISELEKLGIECIMMTGDNKITASSIAKKININKVFSEVLPEDKENKIKELKSIGKTVAMVGDGINDAPALSRADVGIAIGAGSDIAIESCDIVLIKNDLLDVVTAVKLSKATIKNIKENLFFAFIYNGIGIPIACGLLYPLFKIQLNPMIGAIAMSLSSVSVVSNALRLRHFKSNIKNNKKGEIKMKNVKTMIIDGMMCEHCVKRVTDTLNSIDGVDAIVSLNEKKATITLSKDVSDSTLVDAVKNAGYNVISIK